MAEIIQKIFINPPIAIARLGGSTTPQDAYHWVISPNPRSSGETTIERDWSLSVRTDGTVEPTMPDRLILRDDALIRPVCPFFELWALMGEPGSDPATWKDVEVTPALLAQHGADLNDLLVRVNAQNRKAARRTLNEEMGFGTFPPVEIRGDNHAVVPLLATSPPGVPATRRLIPSGRNIPLGAFQVLRSRAQPAPGATPWSEEANGRPLVNVEVIRFRFTPARGRFYGPPAAALPQPAPNGGNFPPVEANQAFLNGVVRTNPPTWVGFDAQREAIDQPSDTYDGASVAETNEDPNPSLGVVDDTCEAQIEVSLALPGGRTLEASANVFVGPPDFAPDRRPFLSLADELNDRTGDAVTRTNDLEPAERNVWVEDLFERIYETVALFNVDFWRTIRAIELSGNRLANPPIAGDHTPPIRVRRANGQVATVPGALGGEDALRNRLFAVAAPGDNEPLPLTQHARMRHRALSDLVSLRDFIVQSPGRLATLIRPPFVVEGDSSRSDQEGAFRTTMRMPPFMRNSNALPLTLAAWQYDLLMSWVRAVETELILEEAAEAAPISEAAAARRAAVLARVRGEQ